jgi:hypothetical protein
MSRLAVNSASSPSLTLRTAETANPGPTTLRCGDQRPSFLGVQSRSDAPAIPSDFCGQCTDENCCPDSVCRYVSRLLLGHCFGAIPAPSGTAPLCFGYAALRVMVPP